MEPQEAADRLNLQLEGEHSHKFLHADGTEVTRAEAEEGRRVNSPSLDEFIHAQRGSVGWFKSENYKAWNSVIDSFISNSY